MQCPSPEEVARFTAGLCEDGRAIEVQGHLDGCETCRAIAERAGRDDPFVRQVRRAFDGMDILAETAEVDAAPTRYRVLRRIGEGGMGVVYEAEQQSPSRSVALKVIRPGLSSADGQRRFEQEAQVLGLLQHPGIAQIYEAGVFEQDGRRLPFLAMELVDGLHLSSHVRKHALRRKSRLRLFIGICAAVHHAHQKGVIHRDLKPGNILVTDNGSPKVLDFGVARVVDVDADVTRTRAGQIIGTLAYMSPEQVRGEAVDTRTDIYALGAILYELLTGKLPLEIAGDVPAAAMQRIEAEEPRPIGYHDRTLRGDLETIVGKALQKSPDRRYGSAAELAEDVERFLRHDPINARPPTTAYQLARFARRHRALVLAATTVFLALVGGIVATYDQMLRARKAEGEKTRALNEIAGEAMSAEAAIDFLAEVLMQGAPSSGAPRDPATTRIILERAADLVDDHLAGDPVVRARVHHVLGDAFTDLGESEDAIAHLERALALYEEQHGERHRRIAYVLVSLSATLERVARFDAAKAAAERALAMRDELPPHMAGLVPESMHRRSRAAFSLGDLEEAIAGMRRAVSAQEGLATGTERHAQMLGDLGAMLLQRGDLGEAEPLLRRALGMQRDVSGERHVKTAKFLGDLANARVARGDLDEAERLRREELDILRAEYGEGSVAVAGATRTLGLLVWKTGAHEDAERLVRASLDAFRASDARHPNVLHSLNILGWMNRDLGRLEAAEQAMRAAVELAADLPADHILTLRARGGLGSLLARSARARDAMPHLEHVLQNAPATAFWAEELLETARADLAHAKALLDKR